MENNSKQIQAWQEQVRSKFGDESRLYEYLLETLENFFYRYLETSSDKNLRASELTPGTWGAFSFETSMVDALKISTPRARAGIIELAKSVPKQQGPKVRYGLWIELEKLTTDLGKLKIVSEIDWGFPHFNDESKRLRKEVLFHYHELGQLRKELALKLESACEIF